MVTELWRYPVKSMLGERVTTLDLVPQGVIGDRAFAVRGADGKLGSGKSSRRFRRMPGLLTTAARLGAGGVTEVQLPDGTIATAGHATTDAALTTLLGEPVELVEDRTGAHLDDAPVHLATTASLRWLDEQVPDTSVDARRLRPNVVVRCEEVGIVEAAWTGRRLRIGSAALLVTVETVRCAMVAAEQQELARAPHLLRALEQGNDLCLGVYATVEVPGRIALGDAVRAD